MAEVTDLRFYVQNTELAPVLDATDALFEQRSGMSRSDALDQHPSGGEWVDAWLSALQETVDDHRSSYYSRLTALAHGMPLESDPHQEISDADWRELCQRLLARYNQLESALHAWQFVYTRALW